MNKGLCIGGPLDGQIVEHEGDFMVCDEVPERQLSYADMSQMPERRRRVYEYSYTLRMWAIEGETDPMAKVLAWYEKRAVLHKERKGYIEYLERNAKKG